MALRNLLVCSSTESKHSIKVADFGLSRLVGNDNYYKSDQKSLPVRWSAPGKRKFSKNSQKTSIMLYKFSLFFPNSSYHFIIESLSHNKFSVQSGIYVNLW